MPQPRRSTARATGRFGPLTPRVAPPRGAPIGVRPGANQYLGKPFPGYVRLQAAPGQPAQSLDLQLVGPARMLDDSYGGGIDVVERQGRVAATVWRGTQPLRQVLPVVLDRLTTVGHVEDEWNQLERLARPPRGVRPPTLRLVGPVLHADRPWLVDALIVGGEDEDWVREQGRLARIRVDVVLVQDVTVDVAEQVVSTGARRERIRTRKGETLRKVARRRYGNGARAREIARLNDLRDIDRVLPTNTLLLLPA